jgi:hypothetical protein
VKTNLTGKCVLISYAMSIIERVLLDSRPVFFVSAGKRGGGKTTAISMAVLAVTGVKPSAAAWSSDPEERRKAIFSCLREGPPTVVFDNIPEGSTISCSHVEAVATALSVKGRVLGESRDEEVPAFTIIGLTGNNISAKGDLASRTLEIRIDVDRPDPENRPVRNAYPLEWTLDHRGEILRALYTIMMGNTQTRPPETRFKTWWTLVGSAIENAALLATDEVVSFKTLFEKVGAKDEDAEGKVELLMALYGLFGDNRSTSADVKAKLDEAAKNSISGATIDTGIDVIREACSRSGYAPTIKSIGKTLSRIIDAPFQAPDGVITLKASDPKTEHDHARRFWVVYDRARDA